MFGMNFNRAPVPTPKAESPVEGLVTDPAALEELRERVQRVVDSNPTMSQVVTNDDVDMVVRFLAQAQEKTGTPYTVESLTDFDEGLPEEVADALAQRLATRGIQFHETHAD